MKLGELIKFRRLLKNVIPPGEVGEPRTISATHLDHNFASCCPKPLKGNSGDAYRISYENGGWTMEPVVQFDVCEDGKPVKYRFVAKKEAQ